MLWSPIRGFFSTAYLWRATSRDPNSGFLESQSRGSISTQHPFLDCANLGQPFCRTQSSWQMRVRVLLVEPSTGGWARPRRGRSVSPAVAICTHNLSATACEYPRDYSYKEPLGASCMTHVHGPTDNPVEGRATPRHSVVPISLHLSPFLSCLLKSSSCSSLWKLVVTAHGEQGVLSRRRITHESRPPG